MAIGHTLDQWSWHQYRMDAPSGPNPHAIGYIRNAGATPNTWVAGQFVFGGVPSLWWIPNGGSSGAPQLSVTGVSAPNLDPVGTIEPAPIIGRIGGARHFARSTDILVSDSALVPHTPNGTTYSGLSVEAWIRPYGVPTNDNVIFQWVSTPNGKEWKLTTNSSGQLIFQWWLNQGGTPVSVTLPGALNPGQWYHVAATFSNGGSSATTISLYVNGQLMVTTSCTWGIAAAASTNGQLSVGAAVSAWPGGQWTGDIDDFRISAGTSATGSFIRSASDILTNYVNGTHLAVTGAVPLDSQHVKVSFNTSAQNTPTTLNTNISNYTVVAQDQSFVPSLDSVLMDTNPNGAQFVILRFTEPLTVAGNYQVMLSPYIVDAQGDSIDTAIGSLVAAWQQVSYPEGDPRRY